MRAKMTQLTIDDLTNNAINRAASHANNAWVNEAIATVTILVRLGADFSTDDVWRILDEKGVTTHERRALGAIIRDFDKSGKIRSISSKRSTRKECHGRYVTVWRPLTRLANV